MVEARTQNQISPEEFAKQVFELHKSEIMSELKRRAIKTDDNNDRFAIATILSGCFELTMNDYYKEKTEKVIEQGWSPEDTEVYYVGWTGTEAYAKIELPNRIKFNIEIVPKKSEDLTKEEYFDIKKVYDELEKEYLENRVKELEEELKKKYEELSEAWSKIRELEQQLEECKNEEEQEDEDDDDY